MKKILYISLIYTLMPFLAFAQKATSQNITELVNKNYPQWDKLYKHFHTNPEISTMEKNTASRMASELRTLGYEVTENVGNYGVVAVLKNGEGKTVLIRADMDALPVEEQTNLPYASKVKTKDKQNKDISVMHACGHDVHMTALIGLAQTLKELKSQWKGTVVLIAQPAEEIGDGAKSMIEAGLFKKFPKPDYALALHVSESLEAGKVGYCEGYMQANVDMVNITVFGEGGHGAYPHATKDPIVMASQMILAFQTIVSREIKPTEPAVITVGSFHAGTKHNIISDRATLQLTLRSYSDEVRNKMVSSIQRIIKNYALAAGMPENKLPTFEFDGNSTPAVFNNIELTKRLKQTASQLLGNENVVTIAPTMGGEDFGLLGRTEDKIPICLFNIGTVSPEKIKESKDTGKNLPSLHSPFYAPVPEPSIKTGVKVMTASVLDLLKP